VNNAAVIRPVAEADLGSVVAMVHELADYERAPDQCHLTVEQLRTALFGDRPALFGHVAELPGGELVGIALWFLNFSTWDGVHGIYLEDLYVRAEHRGGGHGRALLAELAAECARRGYTRLQWSVLDWNEPSIQFYRRLGAKHESEWLGYRLDGPALHRLATDR
jgi:GNAT superfamily N-acetyltransferase